MQSASVYVASIALSRSSDGTTAAKLSYVRHVSGAQAQISSLEPKWLTPTTGIFVSDDGGWANPWFFSLDPNDDNAKPHVERAVQEIFHEEFGGPQWWLSRTFSASLGDNKAAFASFREGRSVLSVFDFSKSLAERKRIEVDADFAQILYVRGNGQKGVFLGQSATKGDSLTEITAGTSNLIHIKPLLPPRPPHPIFRPEYVSEPVYHRLSLKAVPQASLPDRFCHVNFYAPHNPNYSGGADGERPPVILRIHGGPFYMENCALDWTRQFWTSRGWAQ